MEQEKNRFERIEEKLDAILEDEEVVAKKEKKKRPFSIPFTKRVKGKKLRDGYVTVMKINENGAIEFEKKLITEQTVMVDGVPRLATAEHIMYWKKNPLIILPSWSVDPVTEHATTFSTGKNYQDTLKNGANVTGYRLIMNKIQTEAVQLGKKKLSGLGISIGGLLIGGVLIYALLTG